METFLLPSGIGSSCVLQSPDSISNTLSDNSSWESDSKGKEYGSVKPKFIPSCQWLSDKMQFDHSLQSLPDHINESDFDSLGKL